ncbi:MAG: hypothetical protein CMP11_06140 [Zetaproteobacteria bacterium]|nr:hypothetical protein [Pseudobdellovibrionaceae bacterium]
MSQVKKNKFFIIILVALSLSNCGQKRPSHTVDFSSRGLKPQKSNDLNTAHSKQNDPTKKSGDSEEDKETNSATIRLSEEIEGLKERINQQDKEIEREVRAREDETRQRDRITADLAQEREERAAELARREVELTREREERAAELARRAAELARREAELAREREERAAELARREVELTREREERAAELAQEREERAAANERQQQLIIDDEARQRDRITAELAQEREEKEEKEAELAQIEVELAQEKQRVIEIVADQQQAFRNLDALEQRLELRGNEIQQLRFQQFITWLFLNIEANRAVDRENQINRIQNQLSDTRNRFRQLQENYNIQMTRVRDFFDLFWNNLTLEQQENIRQFIFRRERGQDQTIVGPYTSAIEPEQQEALILSQERVEHVNIERILIVNIPTVFPLIVSRPEPQETSELVLWTRATVNEVSEASEANEANEANEVSKANEASEILKFNLKDHTLENFSNNQELFLKFWDETLSKAGESTKIVIINDDKTTYGLLKDLWRHYDGVTIDEGGST